MKIVTIVLGIFLAQLGLSGTPESIMKELEKSLKSSDPAAATRSLLIGDGENVQDQELKLRFDKYFGDLLHYFGRLESIDLVETRKIGKSVIGRVYLLNHEKGPVQFTIIFYKSNDDWVMKHMDLNLDFSKNLSESLKQESLKK